MAPQYVEDCEENEQDIVTVTKQVLKSALESDTLGKLPSYVILWKVFLLDAFFLNTNGMTILDFHVIW